MNQEELRQRLIEILMNAPDIETMDSGILEEYADHLIANGVTIQERGEWIPVSEPPKEKRVEYLCYYKFEPESPDVICENTYYGSGHWLSDEDKVTHWMPLPPPPKTEKGKAE